MTGDTGKPAEEPDLRLRAERPRVTRLSRKALIIVGGISALAVKPSTTAPPVGSG